MESLLLNLATYVFAMSIGDPEWGAETGFAPVGLGAMVGGPPEVTIVGGIAGFTKRSEVRLLDDATMCPCFKRFANTNKNTIIPKMLRSIFSLLILVTIVDQCWTPN